MLRFITRILVPVMGIVFLASISIVDKVEAVSITTPKALIPINTSTTMQDDKTVTDYRNYLNQLKSYQYINMVKAVDEGESRKGMSVGLLLTAIIWKESGFGINITNTRDGEHGSFGVAQILLDTAAKRMKVTTDDKMKRLKLKLLNDASFNLAMAVEELKFWMKYHSKYRSNPEVYWRYVIASYNAGWRSYEHPKGKKYADDVIIRIKALSKFFKEENKNLDKAMNSEIERISKLYR